MDNSIKSLQKAEMNIMKANWAMGSVLIVSNPSENPNFVTAVSYKY